MREGERSPVCYYYATALTVIDRDGYFFFSPAIFPPLSRRFVVFFRPFFSEPKGRVFFPLSQDEVASLTNE
jgi:hypothetical protein